MNRLSIAIVVAVLSLFSSLGHGSNEGKSLTIALIDDLPPFSYERGGGTEKGVDVQIMTELFSRLDMDITLQLIPWARLIIRAEERAISAIGATLCNGVGEWRDFLEYSAPIYTSDISIFSLISSKQKPMRGLNEMSGKKVGKIRDYFYRTELASSGVFETYDFQNDELLLRSLQMKRIDLAIAEELPFEYICKQDDSCDLFQKSYTFDENKICMAFPTTEDNGELEELLANVNAVIAELQEEGFIDAVLAAYHP